MRRRRRREGYREMEEGGSRREGGREGRREGGREGGKEGGKEGWREEGCRLCVIVLHTMRFEIDGKEAEMSKV